ncbi:N-carbamoylputrescine amidase [Alkalibacter rhizosphaerae]|uniref:N-carbamoylputrescine amidase n=1 Tax=Alkalibacter rhizosphaerae TaxID=2815577 RepID=A0A974XP08_9FIRM|nr:N-carbamoylputrescine amidase [Alkalibacter rhizosphaerae]QSX09376.1 N-carbamoylputrescine amidase [Alkalibacter rhizosphaerae]
MRKVKVAATQMACSWNIDENIERAEGLIRKAVGEGANIVLIQELFETPYFCQKEKPEFYNLATTLEENPAIKRFRELARELKVVLPVSFYEQKNNALYNTMAMVDADGSLLGTYRKSHIPDGPGYEEKYYFNPGDTGFKVWDTTYGRIGVGICWDQWFPEAARVMALKGAEILLYPTAIGSEPESPQVDSKDHWQRCMIGHAACNLVPVVASNRIGREEMDDGFLDFYGSSFIAGPTGEMLASCDRESEDVLVVEFDLDQLMEQRLEWGLFRDRRPDLYGPILTMDGGEDHVRHGMRL